MSHVIEVNRIEDLAGFRLLWDSLLGETRRATFFQSLEWLQTYWRHYGRRQKLRALIVCGAEKPIGVLPLCVRTEWYKVGPMRVLTYPLHDWGTFYGPIGPNPTATLLVGMRHLRESPRDWDLVDLRWTDAAGVDNGRTARALRSQGFGAHQAPWVSTAVVNLAEGWDDYFTSRTSKWRTNYRRNERRLQDAGHVEHIHYRPQGAACGDGDPRWDLYDACEEVAGRSWQGASRDGTTLSHESVRPFLRDAHERAAAKGMVDLHLLNLDGRPIAFAYNYHRDGSVFGLRSGFDASGAPDGAGNVMYMRAIRGCAELGDTRYELGPGSFAAKRHILTHTETSYRLTHFPLLDVRAQALRLKRWIKSRRVEPTKLVEKTNKKSRIRVG